MTGSELKDFIKGFEDGSLPKEKWTHKAHFKMALWYTYHYPIHQAKVLIKEGIRHYNLSQGGKNTEDSGYHETITELYIQIIVRYQLAFTRDYTFEMLYAQIDRQGFLERDFPFQFYSRELLMSSTARKKWVAPDIKCLMQEALGININP